LIAKWLSSNGEGYHERGVYVQIEILDESSISEDDGLQKTVELILFAHKILT
jgi:hypothetical protein